ncbi:hypothetical protein LIER_03056 [Lithospermum erythrorhizon]|uniref:Uncharacterized protein n=1 Tax=Lithospermum erythrorhizon TaxID=34254 RepID=A0AAV3NRT8_LITER
MLVQWILNTIELFLRKTIPYFEEARPLWAVLQRRFDVGSGSRKQQLKTTLAECKQPSTMPVADYFGEQLQQKQDNDRLHEFLCGINKEKFGVLQSSLLSQDPPPTLDRAYHAMLQEEQLQDSKASAMSDVVLTMAVPPPPRVLLLVRVRRGVAEEAGLVRLLRLDGDAGQVLLLVQWEKLISLLGTSDIGSNDKLTDKLFVSNWIIDYGASSHITDDLSILSDSIDISACPVGCVSIFPFCLARSSVCSSVHPLQVGVTEIGQVVQSLDGQPQVALCFLSLPQCLGRQKNKLLLLIRQQKQSIDPWQL